MSALTLRKSRVHAHRRPWVLRGPAGRVIGAFGTFPEALQFLRTLTGAAQQ